MNIKTEESKLREEIEKIEKTFSERDVLGRIWTKKNSKWRGLKIQLQQLLADKKMFKDAVESRILMVEEKKRGMRTKIGDSMVDGVIFHLKELLKILGIREEEK